MKDKNHGIGQAYWDLLGHENVFYFTNSEKLLNFDIPYFRHFDTFWVLKVVLHLSRKILPAPESGSLF